MTAIELDDLFARIDAKKDEVQDYVENGDFAEAKTAFEELQELVTELSNQINAAEGE